MALEILRRLTIWAKFGLVDASAENTDPRELEQQRFGENRGTFGTWASELIKGRRDSEYGFYRV
jgi:hypothetical protein